MDNDDNNKGGEVEWVVYSVKHQHFLKSATVQIGDQIFKSKKSNILNNQSTQQQLPRAWIRLLSSYILLTNLSASMNQIQHYLYVSCRLLFDDEPRYFLHLLEHGKFIKNNNLLLNDIKLIREYLQNELHSRSTNQLKRFKSLTDSSNRKRDRKRVENQLFLPELGYQKCSIKFYNKNINNQLISTNYNRIVYGDHGPYIEFTSDQINWDSFPNTQAKGASVAYYDEFYTTDKTVKLYSQVKTVHDQPNPPAGKYSENHNRSEGYADYKIGLFYVSPDDLYIDTSNNEICPYLYLIMMSNRDDFKRKQLRNRNISRASSSKQFNKKFNHKYTRNQQKLNIIKEREEKKQQNNDNDNNDNDKQFKVYNPKILKIEILKTPRINTQEGKRIINSCLNGTYVPGLIYVPNFITETEQIDIKNQLISKSSIWSLSKIQMKRRSIQFGYHLDYSTMELYIAKEKELKDIPSEWKWIAIRIQKFMENKFNKKCKPFNQLILNEYAPNQGIRDHTDRTHCFGPVIAGLSLFSPCVMNFTNKKNKNMPVKPALLYPRSMFILTGQARYEYTHGITDEREHKFCGHTIRKGVRYSMTFRHAIPNSSAVLTRSSYNDVSNDAMTVV